MAMFWSILIRRCAENGAQKSSIPGFDNKNPMKEDNRNAEIVFDPILNLGFAQGEGIGVRSVLGFPSVGYNSVLIAGILINSWRQPVGISQKKWERQLLMFNGNMISKMPLRHSTSMVSYGFI